MGYKSDIDRNDASQLIESYSKLTGCGIHLVSAEEGVVSSAGTCSCSCGRKIKASDGTDIDCFKLSIYSGEQSERFGGLYIYACPADFVFCISPVMTRSAKKYYLLCGPMLAMSKEDYTVQNQLSTPEEEEYLGRVPYVQPDMITHISKILYVLANHISGIEYRSVVQKHEMAIQQQQINEYIQSIKTRLVTESQGYISYPYDKEKQLFHAIITGDLVDARRFLNEILGHIFFSSANNLETIKVRAMELAVMISRAALDSGGDINNIFKMNMQFITHFFSLNNIEDVCYSLTELLHRFSDETFDLMQVKHVDLLSKATSYIKTHYMHKITLEEVAAHVYLSPSYFSKIFKEEMGCHFNVYLNNIRIEKSKILLVAESVSIIEIAELVGFLDQSYFNKVFKKYTGVTPKKFRELNGQIPYKES